MSRVAAGSGDAPGGPRAAWLRVAAGALALGLICYLAQATSIALRFPPSGISTIYLPGGPFLAALLVTAPRRWWLHSIAASAGIFAALFGDFPTPALLVLLLVLSATFSAVAAAVRRVTGGPPRFNELRHVLVFLLAGGLLLPVIAGLAAAVISVTSGWRDRFWQLLPTIVMMGTLGIVTITPPAVVGLSWGLARLRSAPARWWVEAALLGAGVLAVSLAAFGGDGAEPGLGAVWLLYTPVPFLLWAAARFGAPGISAALLLVALVSTANAVAGRGPFAAHTPADNVRSLQLTMLASGVPLIILGTVMDERRRTTRALAASEADARHRLAELAIVYRTAPVGLAFLDTSLRFIKVNDHLAEIDGRPAADHIGRALREVVPNPLGAELEVTFREVIAKNQPATDLEIREAGRTWLASYFPVRDDCGSVLGVNTVVREVTAEKRAAEELRQSHAEVQNLAGRLIAAQEAERTRIARELHDDINQRLAAHAIALSGLKQRLARAPGDAAVAVSRLQSDVAQITDDIRNLSHELHPGVLQHAGLVAALEAHFAEVRSGTTVEVAFETDDTIGDLPADAALCLYRVAQESLRNVTRHANARRVWVALARTGSGLELVVTDDGTGFDPARVGRGGLGLISLEERVRLAGGTCRVSRTAGGGTEVRATVPVAGGAG